MRYGPVAAPRLEAGTPPAAAPAGRGRLGLSHQIAAVAAVSGIALAAAYPALSGVDDAPAMEAASATSRTVESVTVPSNADYEIMRSSLTSSFTEKERLDSVMTASGGDITKVDTGGVLAQPVDSVRITSRFGMRVNPVTGYGVQSHIGQDYGVKCGTPVKAAAAGTVAEAGWAGHSGNRVRVNHGNGLETTYNHNTRVAVEVGQRVERGELVSSSGTTGNSTGCHLHFEVLVDGEAVDPAGWL